MVKIANYLIKRAPKAIRNAVSKNLKTTLLKGKRINVKKFLLARKTQLSINNRINRISKIANSKGVKFTMQKKSTMFFYNKNIKTLNKTFKYSKSSYLIAESRILAAKERLRIDVDLSTGNYNNKDTLAFISKINTKKGRQEYINKLNKAIEKKLNL